MIDEQVVIAIVLSCAVLVTVGYVGALTWRSRPGQLWRSRPYRRFNAFMQVAQRALARPGTELGSLFYVGYQRSYRRTRVSFVTTGARPLVRLAVSTARDVPRLHVRVENALLRLRRDLGAATDLQTGDRAFDERFFLEADDRARGRKALGKELRQKIDEAFARPGIERLVLQPGELLIEADPHELAPGEWKGLLLHLERAAALIERKPVRVRVLGGERDVVVDPEGKTRCAYCRDGITGEEDDLVACDRCRTVLHAACWEEHGSCPMLGCEGEAPERARVGYGEPS